VCARSAAGSSYYAASFLLFPGAGGDFIPTPTRPMRGFLQICMFIFVTICLSSSETLVSDLGLRFTLLCSFAGEILDR
jgi:hypothetical protein